MRYIVKKKTPQSLLDYKRTPNATYDGFGAKDEVRCSLIQEQKGLCAYCNGRISNDWDRMFKKYKTGIEHAKSQDYFPHLQLDYNNMLGVCNGTTKIGENRSVQHCDKSKANQLITIDPLSPHCENFIRYTPDGRILSDNEAIKHDLVHVLNLNQPILLRNRRDIIDVVHKRMDRFYPKKEGQGWTKLDIQKEINYWEKEDSDGYLKPYLQVALYYLNNKLKRLV